MSRKVGRPQADNPKSIKYSIRLDSMTEERLKEYCEKHSMSKGEAIRQGIELLLASDD
jgi:predicted DNA-binding protein